MDRRTFLRSTLAAGAVAMTSTGAEQTNANERKELRVALLGAGMQGEVLLNACLKMGTDAGVRFKAVCDIWEDLTLKRVVGLLGRYGHEPTGYVDYREMLDKEKDLDVVLVATPDFVHAEQAVACLKAGLHVYCEVPMSNSLEGARAMVQASRDSGRLLQIGQQRRSNPRYIHCRTNLVQTARLLGRMVAGNVQWNRPARPDRGWSKRREVDPAVLQKYGYASMHQYRNWMWYKDLSAGPVGDFGVHQLDVVNWFLGVVPKSITARGGTYYYDPKTHEWYDMAMAVLEYETDSGLVCVSYQDLSTNGYGGHAEILMGDQGTLEISESPGRTGAYRDPEAPDWDKWVGLGFLKRPGAAPQAQETPGVLAVQETKPPLKYEIPVTMQDPYHQGHLRNFFDAIRGKTSLNCPADAAWGATVTALKINEAIAAGRTLAFSPADFEL